MNKQLKTLEQIFIEFEFNVIHYDDLVNYIAKCIEYKLYNNYEKELLDIANADIGNDSGIKGNDFAIKKAIKNLKRLVLKENPNFSISSKETESYLEKMILQLCNKIVKGTMDPIKMEIIVDSMEGVFPGITMDFYGCFNSMRLQENEHGAIDMEKYKYYIIKIAKDILDKKNFL